MFKFLSSGVKIIILQIFLTIYLGITVIQRKLQLLLVDWADLVWNWRTG